MSRARHLTPWLLLVAFAASGAFLGVTWLLAVAPIVALIVPLLAGRYVGETMLARWARRRPAGRPRPRARLRPRRTIAFTAAVFAAATASRAPPVQA